MVNVRVYVRVCVNASKVRIHTCTSKEGGGGPSGESKTVSLLVTFTIKSTSPLICPYLCTL